MDRLQIHPRSDVVKRAPASEIIAGYLDLVSAGVCSYTDAANSIICALDDQNKALAAALMNANASLATATAALSGAS